MTLRVHSEGPYYDDYQESKGFYRILFKPGVAVQARELTQLQTILQKQVERFGSHVFKDGSVVLGGQTSYDFTCKFVRVNKTLDGNDVVSSIFEDRMIQGSTAIDGVVAKAKVIKVVEDDDYFTLIVKDFSGVNWVQGDDVVYQPDPDVAGTVIATVYDPADDYSHQGRASMFHIDSGVFYTHSHFVFVDPQSIVLSVDKYSPDNLGNIIVDGTKPSARCGLNVVETIVDSDVDTTLLDPSLGSYNYNAPGADRYSIELQLASYNLLKQAVAVPVVNESTTAITSINIIDGGNGYPTSDFLDTAITFTGSTLDATGNGAEGQVTSVDPDTGTITSIALPNGGSGFRQSTAKITIAEPTDDLDNFIELSRFDDGELIKNVRFPIYSNLGDTLARRTYDESGDYSLNPFVIRLSDHLSDQDLFVINVDPGKAYVRGFEIELISTTRVNANRARSAAHQRSITSYNINSYYGNYVLVNEADITKVFNPLTFPTLNLYDSTPTLIGTATLVNISLESAGVYRFHLANVSITGTGKSFADVVTMKVSTDTSIVATIQTANRVLVDTSSAKLLFKLPQSNVKTVSDSVDYSYKVLKTGTVSSGAFTITQTGGVQFREVGSSVADKEASYILFNTTNNTVLDLTATAISTTFNGSTATATFSGGMTDGHNYTVLAAVQANNVGRKDKTKVSNYVYTVTPASTDKSITLDKWDGINLVSVMGGATDYTARFTFDNGQRDANYDYARLVLKPGEKMPAGSLDITYNYFSHGSSGNYFSVDSYPDYDEIPTYTTLSGEVVGLENVLDFRFTPGSDDPVVPDIEDDIEVDFTYYLGRVDRVVLNSKGEVLVIEGIPDVSPKKPPADRLSMTLGLLSIAPYTKNVKKDVQLQLVDNKRYTMRDIGVLDDRIGRLEYYNALNLLEKAAKDLLVLDANGNDRFKNGMLVDGFQGHSISDSGNPDFYAAISYSENFCTCPTIIKALGMRPINAERDNVAIKQDLVSLAYSSVPFITQGKASKAISVNPFNVTTFEGKMLMDPPSDFWKDIEQLPDIVINQTGENDQWLALQQSLGINPATGFAITYGSWKDNWTGLEPTQQVLNETSAAAVYNPSALAASTRSASRTVTKVSLAFDTITKSQGQKIVNVSVIPYMRVIDIYFAATGMKPNTRLYPFFDDKEINDETQRSEVLSIKTVTGGLEIPQIKCFEYPAGMPHVAQDTVANGVVTGKVIMIRGGLMHVVLDDPTKHFEATSNPARQLEFRWDNLSSDGILEEYNTNFEITNVNEASTGAATSFKTDSFGSVSGVYTVPEATFYTGDRVFKLIDDLSNNRMNATTVSEYMFASFGMKVTQQETFVTTRVPVIKKETYKEEMPLWVDPIAESFLVDPVIYPQGVFLESVDLFFKNKDENVPVTIEIRPTVNGYPHSSTVIPGSVVEKDPSEVNITNIEEGELTPSLSDPATITNFKFNAPVFLMPGKEYALVIKSNSNLYEAYVAEMGALQLGATTIGQKITEQPYTGSLFKSQNSSTWTAAQEEDLMFRLNRCQFVSSGSLIVTPDGYLDRTDFDYDLFFPSANNIEFDGIANVAYSYKTTVASTDTIETDFTPFTIAEEVYFDERRRLSTNYVDIAGVTAQAAYDLPFTGETIDTVDVLVRATENATTEAEQSKTLYRIREKTGAPGTYEIAFQSTVKDPPTTGNFIRIARSSGTQIKFDLSTSNPHVSPIIDLADFLVQFIQNQINDAGVKASSFDIPTDADIPTPKITVGGGGSGAKLLCVMRGGELVDVIIEDGGTGYSSPTGTVTTTQTTPPSVTATITLTQTGGVIDGVIITNGGAGYLSPTLAITSTEGSGASVYPTVTQATYNSETSGYISEFYVANEGSGYVDDWSAVMTRQISPTLGTTTVNIGVNNESGATGGNSVARYISRRVTLKDGFDAEDLKVYATVMKPQASDIDVYYKVLASDDGTLWSDRGWVRMIPTGNVQSLNLTDYKEMEFGTVDGTCAYDGFTNFKMFAIKITMRAANTSQVPRIKDMRAIALDTAYTPV